MRNMERKRENHYVWAKILRNWSNENGEVFHYPTKKGIGCDSVKMLAKERDFYEFHGLNEIDVEFIRFAFKGFDKNIRNQCEEELLKLFSVSRKIEKFGFETEGFLVFKSNLLEDLQTKYELNFSPILEMLKNKDLSFVSDIPLLCDALMYLSMQLMRTKFLKNTALDAIKNYGKGEIEINGISLNDLWNKNWHIINYFLARNLTLNWIKDRKLFSFSILINKSERSFITSDRSVFNLHQSANSLVIENDVEFSDVYYPFSPKLAFWSGESDRYGSGLIEVDESEVISLNNSIIKKGYKLIIANSEEEIKLSLKKSKKK